MIYYIRYITINNISYLKINSANPLYLNIDKVNEYIEEMKETTYLTLASSDENKDTIKKYTKLWVKIKDLIKPITNTSGDYN